MISEKIGKGYVEKPGKASGASPVAPLTPLAASFRHGRVMALAVQDGAGAPLVPPHFAVIEISMDCRLCYTRFIHPQDVVQSLSPYAELLRWFMGGDISFGSLEFIRQVEQRQGLTQRAAAELVCDERQHCILMAPRDMPWYWSPLSQQRRITICEYDFELFCLSNGYRPDPAGRAKPLDLANRFYLKYPELPGERVRVEAHAQELGMFSKAKDK